MDQELLPRHRKKTALERRQQRRRAEARQVCRIMQSFSSVRDHRGGQLSKLGAALLLALEASGDNSDRDFNGAPSACHQAVQEDPPKGLLAHLDDSARSAEHSEQEVQVAVPHELPPVSHECAHARVAEHPDQEVQVASAGLTQAPRKPLPASAEVIQDAATQAVQDAAPRLELKVYAFLRARSRFFFDVGWQTMLNRLSPLQQELAILRSRVADLEGRTI